MASHPRFGPRKGSDYRNTDRSRVVVLGSGGWIPTDSRETCSILVRVEDHALLLDAGTGVRRLVSNPDLVDGVGSLDIVLSHFHLDHVVGLAYLPALHMADRTRIWGPGALLYEAATVAYLRRLLGTPLFPARMTSIVAEINDLTGGGDEIGPHIVTSRRQNLHSDPTVAIRVGDIVVYCTDTGFDQGNAGFAADAQILFHEAWFTESSLAASGSHSSAADAGRIAQSASCDQLCLVHLNPLSDLDRELEEEAQGRFAGAAVSHDWDSYYLLRS